MLLLAITAGLTFNTLHHPRPLGLGLGGRRAEAEVGALLQRSPMAVVQRLSIDLHQILLILLFRLG